MFKDIKERLVDKKDTVAGLVLVLAALGLVAVIGNICYWGITFDNAEIRCVGRGKELVETGRVTTRYVTIDRPDYEVKTEDGEVIKIWGDCTVTVLPPKLIVERSNVPD